jgi:hypothetical protein
VTLAPVAPTSMKKQTRPLDPRGEKRVESGARKKTIARAIWSIR